MTVILITGYIPNGLEALAAMLAVSSIGAIWSSTSPEFGVTVSASGAAYVSPSVPLYNTLCKKCCCSKYN